MQHLEAVRLAALTDEAPTSEELLHLAACTACRDERDAFVALSALAVDAGNAPVGSNAPRLTNWNSLSAQLRAEGLITGEPVTAEYPVPTVVRSINGGARVEAAPVARIVDDAKVADARHVARVRVFSLLPAPYLQIAATLTLLLGGMAIGRKSAGVPVVPTMATSTPGIFEPVVNSGTFAGYPSVAEATKALSQAQSDYQRASLWLADHDTSVTPEMYRKRLAALDQMTETTREALHLAPQDQLLKNYYQATMKARETTLMQLSSVLPVDKALERF